MHEMKNLWLPNRNTRHEKERHLSVASYMSSKNFWKAFSSVRTYNSYSKAFLFLCFDSHLLHVILYIPLSYLVCGIRLHILCVYLCRCFWLLFIHNIFSFFLRNFLSWNSTLIISFVKYLSSPLFFFSSLSVSLNWCMSVCLVCFSHVFFFTYSFVFNFWTKKKKWEKIARRTKFKFSPSFASV